MRYISNTLLQNEKLIYYTRPHWIIFAPTFFSFLVALILYSKGPDIFGPVGNLRYFNLYVYEILAILAAIIGLFGLINAYITFQTSEYGITDRRILMKTGWIRRNSLEVFLDKIEAVKVNQSIFGRVLNYGTLIIVGTGGTEDPFFSIPAPLHFRKKVQQQIDLYDNRFSR